MLVEPSPWRAIRRATRPRDAGRAVGDQVLRHPVAALVMVGTRVVGLPLGRSVVLAGIVDQLVPAATAHQGSPVARFLRLWSLAVRFQHRWPGSLLQAERLLDHRVAVGRGSARVESSDPTHHEDWTVPPLARLPHRIDGTTVAWAIEIGAESRASRLAREAKGLALVDPRLLAVDVRRRDPAGDPDPDVGWEVVVDFDIEPPPLALTVRGDRQSSAAPEADRGTSSPA